MPPKASDGSSGPRITDFFKRFTIPKERRPSNDVPEENIVVASSRPGSRSLETRAQLPRTKSPSSRTPQKPKSIRASPLSSSPSQVNTLKRKRTSPRIAQAKSVSASPTSSQNASQQRNINPITGASDVTPTADSPFREPSATPSRRVLLGSTGSASSKSKSKSISPEQMAAPPIPPPQFTRSSKETSAVASFTSTSTLSTLPLSSQTSMPISSTTSSRRVVRGGLCAVTNSDEDDDDDSSDDGLADIRNFLPKKAKLTPPAELPRNVSGSSTRQSTNGTLQGAKTRFSRPLILSPPRTDFKNSRLAKLVEKNEERRRAQERIKAMEMEVEESKQRDALEEDDDDNALDREVLLDLAVDDDQREELIIALSRTEALRAANHYHFFLDDQPKWPNSPFPVDSVADEPWSGIYCDNLSRDEACISGLAAELAERYPLPMNITLWFASQLMHEPSEMLCEAYVEILRVSSKHHHDTSMSDTIASLTSRYYTRSFFENDSKHQVKKALPRGLQYVLRTLQFCAPASDSVVSDSTPATTCAAFLDLALLNIDVLVRSDVNLSNTVANCIEEMLDALPETSFVRLKNEVLGTLFLPGELPPLIRCRAISNLPCKTLRAYSMRRRLALECFSTVSDRKLADSQDWQASILHTLKTQPALHIAEDTDFDYLMALIAVLDIAIANGFAEYSSLVPPAPPAQTTGSLMFSRPQPLTEAERSHNQQIDRVVEQLNTMMSRIKDSGTSHLGRTQAKSLMEGVVVRLDSCVRTRPRAKKSVFNRGIQVKFEMPQPTAVAKPRVSNLRERLLEVKQEKDAVETVPVEMLSDREQTPNL